MFAVGVHTQPGVYEVKDGIQEYLRLPHTYNFRGLARETWGSHMVGHADKVDLFG